MTKFLMESGRNDLIFTFANQTTFPSYGYFLSLGLTTWPETWSGQLGSSLMHGCFNAIGLWWVDTHMPLRAISAASVVSLACSVCAARQL